MSSGVSLYYPYIHIQDEGWLKSSLLYWDRVRRIVPDGFEPKDWGDCYAAAEAGVLVRASPTPYLFETAQRFRSKIPALLAEINRRGESLEVQDPAPAERNRDIRIHTEKMEYTLRRFLIEEQIATVRGEWMVSHPDVTDWYMTCLTTVMSEKIGSPIVTDRKRNNDVGEYLTHANPTPGEENIEQGRAMLRLRIPFPDADRVAKVPIRKILRLREKYADQRRNLRDAVEELMKEIPTISDANDLRDHLRDKEARLNSAIQEQRRAADRFYNKTLPSFLQISAPTGLLALGINAGMPPFILTVIGAGAVALLARGWWAKFKDDEAAIKAKPYQYLLTLEDRFGSMTPSSSVI
jgi:hypothetical protein